MRLHPLHPVSVHFPIACIVFTPLADLGAAFAPSDAWHVFAAWSAVAGAALGVLAGTIGTLDVERALNTAPRVVIAHLSLMLIAVALSGVSAAGRFAVDYAVRAEPESWAVIASGLAAIALLVGGYFGGELVYGRGVGVYER